MTDNTIMKLGVFSLLKKNKTFLFHYTIVLEQMFVIFLDEFERQ